MVQKISDARAKRGDDGYAFPLFLVLVVLSLAVFLVFLIATASPNPSISQVEKVALAVTATNNSTLAANTLVTCTYDADRWVPGQTFTCSFWGASSAHNLTVLADTTTVTVQSAPAGMAGHFASFRAASSAHVLLVNVDALASTFPLA
jgi:hypothetical protein